MAIYHFSVQVIGRASGRSAVAAAAYRAGERLHDERLDRDHDFRAKSGVEHSEIMLPEGAPERFSDRATLWNEVEATEKRKDAQLAREVEFSIPREMNRQQGIELARDFVGQEFVARGMIADLNVHWDPSTSLRGAIGADDQPKPHAHVMLTMREVGKDGFGAKERDWNRTELVEQWRERWADHVNARLAELDIDARIDHRSLEAQGIELEPQDKIGPAAQRMGERGLESERIEDHRETAQRNGERIIADPRVALDAITHQQATFTTRDLAMFVHRHSDGKEQYDRAMSAVRASPELVALGKDGRGDDRFTSREMIETEQRLQRASELMAERERHRVDEKDRTAVLASAEGRGLVLAGEQRAAFDHVTGERGLSVVVGYAGTGKSAMLGVAREAWERAGFEVRGAALSGIAAEGLENGSGIASRTIASMEHGWSQGRDLLTARDVLVIDEAGMVGTRQMERVLSHAADAGAKIVLVGDPQQLQAIEAGAAFRAINERHGGVEITEVRRQHEEWQRDATRQLATGRTGEAIRAYADHGMVHAAETREQARGELVERWDSERIAAPDQTRIILTHTNDEVRELNEAARDRMRVAGQLGDDVRMKTERGDRAFAIGDRLMFLKNERSLEVKNGTLGTVEQVNQQSMTVRTDDGRSVAFDMKDYAHVDHGYAATIHKAQGMTVDRAHMLATPGMDRHGAYVGMSRHRDGLAVHYGRDDFKDESRLVRILSRERTKDMAGDYDRRDPAQRDPTQEFAERRGIGVGERIAEMARAGAEKARGIFDGLRLSLSGQQREPSAAPEPRRGMFDGLDLGRFVSQPDPARQQQHDRNPQPLRASGLRGAVERYARAVDAIRQTRAQGIDAMPHQREALDKARDALDAIRPQGSTDLDSAFRGGPELIREAAEGLSQAAMRAMQLEAEIRIDPFQRADRFIEGWQQLQRAHGELMRDGDFRGAKTTAQHMADMAKSLERDAQLESVLGLRSRELGLEIGQDMGRSIGRDLAASIPFDHDRDISRGMER
ncbi:conjugal transfer protein TraA [Sphingobium yanoikuyae]|jgi:Ti-type conjugative transfer relaxase TraA|uniref:Conjugal transfer protein TraA n=1 Tax=Sphingobium yanoikuyae TaxID=13690 RepID=A0A177JQ47_SPHYA|nr:MULTISPECIES: Ti-type conjugative transfer relaxase TraA [Sphingobium]KZC79440.1 conjugal transfer protein TraA [Sphingobium yanoikuyae]OAH43303.1 conjugal transfer protein TraA [Sphingobium yanoikuyae]PHP18920.1 Ti-type conjugative transfer relaxase TraA [Sphingobium sp. IP1]RSU74321.1 Ti-type conjugative transfer relaxase TraA [Sphingomonas sp. S-NIH.Pt3_0716]